MAAVEFRPGDMLNIVCTMVHETPLGAKAVESNFELSYEDLLRRLGARSGKARKSGTQGARFSRMVALSVHALRKGTWATGASIDRRNVFANMVAYFRALTPQDYGDVTKVAKGSLLHLHETSTILKPKQREELVDILRAFDLMKDFA